MSIKELVMKIEGQLQTQVDHIFKYYENNELRQKMYDLAFEWYIKGLHAGIECERTDQTSKKNVVFCLFNIDRESFEGVYAVRQDAQDMIDSFGSESNEYKIEEHEVIV